MRPNPILMKNRDDTGFRFKHTEEENYRDIPKGVFVILAAVFLLFLLTGCNHNPEKERIVIQIVKIPVPAECPKPQVSEALTLPSTQLSNEESNKDLKGSILNQTYLMNRVFELENILSVYMQQVDNTNSTNTTKVEELIKEAKQKETQ